MFVHRFRVRYAECDPQGIVFNARYLEYADLMFGEMLRTSGLPLGSLEVRVARAELDYARPSYPEEEIEGRVSIVHIGNSSMKTRIDIRGAGESSARVTILMTHVQVDPEHFRPMRISDEIRTILAPLHEVGEVE